MAIRSDRFSFGQAAAGRAEKAEGWTWARSRPLGAVLAAAAGTVAGLVLAVTVVGGSDSAAPADGARPAPPASTSRPAERTMMVFLVGTRAEAAAVSETLNEVSRLDGITPVEPHFIVAGAPEAEAQMQGWVDANTIRRHIGLAEFAIIDVSAR